MDSWILDSAHRHMHMHASWAVGRPSDRGSWILGFWILRIGMCTIGTGDVARVPGKSRAHVRLDPGGSYSIPDMLLADAPVPPTCKSPQELFHAFTGLLHTECIKMGLVYGIPSRFGQSITARFPLQIPIRFLWGAERCRRWSRRRTLHP